MNLKISDIINPIHPNRSTALFGGNASGILNWNDLSHPSMYEMRTKVRAQTKGSHSLSFDRKIELNQQDKELVNSLILSNGYLIRLINLIEAYATDPSVVSVFSTISDQLEEQIKSLFKLNDSMDKKVSFLENGFEVIPPAITSTDELMIHLTNLRNKTENNHTSMTILYENLNPYILGINALTDDLILELKVQLEFYNYLIELYREELTKDVGTV